MGDEIVWFREFWLTNFVLTEIIKKKKLFLFLGSEKFTREISHKLGPRAKVTSTFTSVNYNWSKIYSHYYGTITVI